jgi:hypothetical protein
LRCPYQAKVMKILEMNRRMIGEIAGESVMARTFGNEGRVARKAARS